MFYKIKPFIKKDGELMMYINSYNQSIDKHGNKKYYPAASIGISASRGVPAPYGKTATAGMKRIIDNIENILNELPVVGHAKPVFENCNINKMVILPIGILYLTDDCQIGNVKVNSDGCYLYRNGVLLDCNYFVEA